MNNKYPTLKNAPIVEALMDIQVQLPERITLNELHAAVDKVKLRFPTEQKRYKISSLMQLKPGEEPLKQMEHDTKVEGFLFFSENNDKVFQSRLDGFTFNKHKPYMDWNSLKEEGKELWAIYKNIADPISIKRIALRYINKIPLKTPFDPSNYLTTLPKLSNELNYSIQNLFSQITIINQRIDAFANITEAIENTGSDMSYFIFDIDVYKSGDLKELDIWEYFDQLRNFKNEIFFESLTETTLKLIA